MTRLLLLGTAVFLGGLVLGAGGLLFVQTQTDWGKPKGPPASPGHTGLDQAIAAAATCDDDQNRVTALARLEPSNGVISMNGTPGDRLETLRVELGDHVKKGMLLATLESHALRKTELDVAKSQLAEAKNRKASEERYADAMLAEAELAEKQAGLHRLDRNAQQDKVDGLEAAARSAHADLARLALVRGLPDDAIGAEIVSNQQMEHQELACKKADKELAAAEAELEKLDASVRLADEEARAKRKTAEANRARVDSMVQIESLTKQVALAQQRVDLTELRAPSDGQVLKTFVSPGDTLTQMPVLQMADTTHMVANAEVYEDEVGRIKPHARACISSRALPAPLLGTLEVIGQMVSKNTVVGLNPTDSSDIRVVEARIRLDRVADGTQAKALQDAAGKLTPDKAYRYQIVFAGGPHQSQSLPSTPIGPITLSHGQNAVRLSEMPKADKMYSVRRIYRTQANGSVFRLLCTQAGDDARRNDYLDTKADADLGSLSSLRPLVNLQVNAAIEAAPPEDQLPVSDKSVDE